jgi:hypothetical protein
MSQFREKGYQVFNSVISPELVTLLHGVLAFEVDKILALLSRVGVEPDIATAAKDIVALLNTPSSADELDRDTRVLMTGHFPAELRLSKDILGDPAHGRASGYPQGRARIRPALHAHATDGALHPAK